MSDPNQLHRSLKHTDMGPLHLPPPHLPRLRRHPPLRGHLRRRPVRHVPLRRGQAQLELLQPLLLQHGAGHAHRPHHRRLHPGQRRLGLGTRHSRFIGS